MAERACNTGPTNPHREYPLRGPAVLSRRLVWSNGLTGEILRDRHEGPMFYAYCSPLFPPIVRSGDYKNYRVSKAAAQSLRVPPKP